MPLLDWINFTILVFLFGTKWLIESCRATDKKLRGSPRTRQIFFAYYVASGIRSEYSSHSWSILAGSSHNRLQQRIRNPAARFFQRLLALQEDRKRTGHGTRCNDWIACFFLSFCSWNKNSMSILELTSWHAFPMQNSIQTTLCLSFKVRASFSICKKDGMDRAGWKKRLALNSQFPL